MNIYKRLKPAGKRHTAFLMAVLLMAVLALVCFHTKGWRKSGYPRQLVYAHALCDRDIADSARLVYSTFLSGGAALDEPSRWYARLLELKLKIKERYPFKDDADALALIRHYTDGDDAKSLLEAYYCAGCVYKSLDDYPQALECFIAVVESDYDAPDVRPLKARCCYQLGYIYSMQGLDAVAIPWQQKSLCYNLRAKDLRRSVYDYENLAWSYEAVGRHGMALSMLSKAMAQSRAIDDAELQAEVCSQLANHYNAIGSLPMARKYLEMSTPCVNDATRSSTYSLALEIYSKLCLRDSVSKYSALVLGCGTPNAKRYAYRLLTDSALRRASLDQACAYYANYKKYVDSVENTSSVEALAKASAMYNYAQIEKANAKLLNDKARYRIYVVLFLLAVMLLALSFAVLYMSWRRRRKRYEVRLALLRSSFATERRLSSAAVEEKELEIRHIREQLQDMIKANSQRKAELEKKADICQNEVQTMKCSAMSQAISERLVSESAIYKELMVAIDAEPCKFDKWQELYAMTFDVYPDFRQKLGQLKRMSDIQMKVCVLLKIGVPSLTISRLTYRSQDTIYSICRRLYYSNFRQTGSYRMWATFIRTM